MKKSLRTIKRGGKRKGAGRPPRLHPRKAITIRLEPEHADQFRQLCKNEGISHSRLMTRWIETMVWYDSQ